MNSVKPWPRRFASAAKECHKCLLLRHREAHQEVIAHKIGLLQWRALEVKAFEDQVRVVSVAEVNHDDHQALLDDVENALRIDLFALVALGTEPAP